MKLVNLKAGVWVNPEAVSQVAKRAGGGWVVVLTDGRSFELAKDPRKALTGQKEEETE